MLFQGYMRFPTLYQDSIVFVAEDDLWLIKDTGGHAERLTAGIAEMRTPRFSPDGAQLAFVSRAEGRGEVYCMVLGEETRRLTFQAAWCNIAKWSAMGIIFSSNVGMLSLRAQSLYWIDPQGGLPHPLSYGLANAITFGPQGGAVIGRNAGEPAHWKRYRGGRIGQLWCNSAGDGQFRSLIRLEGNLAAPCWIGERIYFISDHEGIGNIPRDAQRAC